MENNCSSRFWYVQYLFHLSQKDHERQQTKRAGYLYVCMFKMYQVCWTSARMLVACRSVVQSPTTGRHFYYQYEMIVLGTTKLPSRWRYFIGPFKSWTNTLRAHVGNGISWRVGYFLYHFQSDKNLEFFLYYNFTKIVTGSTRMLGSNRSSSARKPKKSTSR